MLLHKARILNGLILVMLMLVARVQAQETAATGIDPRIVAVTPFLDADAFLVVHVDLKKLDIKESFDRLAALVPAAVKDKVDQAKLMLPIGVQLKDQLVAAGVTDLYVIGTQGAGGEEPEIFALAPVEPGKDVDSAKSTIKSIPGMKEGQLFVHNGVLVSGSPKLKEYLPKLRAAELPPLADAFKYSGVTTMQVIFMPNKKITATAKDAIAKAAPGTPIPDESTDDMKSIVITANLPANQSAKPALAIIGHAKDEAAAKTAVEEALKSMESPEAQQVLTMPALATLAPFLKPVQDGPRVKILFTEANGGIDALANSIQAGLEMLVPMLGGLGGFPGM